jgi:hypothetical protein
VAPAPAPSSGGIGGALASFTGALVRGTSKVFGQVQKRGGTALAGFRARPEHSRWRVYALGTWSAIVATTLAFQFWTDNPLGVYVKIQHVDIPRSTFIFVRNDSPKPWRNARLKLNGVYSYDRPEVSPGDNLRLEPGQFTVLDSVSGRQTKFPRTGALETLSMDCDQGHYETMLRP